MEAPAARDRTATEGNHNPEMRRPMIRWIAASARTLLSLNCERKASPLPVLGPYTETREYRLAGSFYQSAGFQSGRGVRLRVAISDRSVTGP